MAEAIAALSLAANILQVLGAGAKFAETSWTLATTERYDVSNLKELRHITAYLKPLLQRFQSSQAKNSGSVSLTESDNQLKALSVECSQLVHELLRTLDETGVNDERKKLDSVVTAFKLSWKRTQIGDLVSRISQLRDQLSFALLISMREQASQTLEHQEATLHALQQDARYMQQEHQHERPARGSESAINAPGTVMLTYLCGLLDSDDKAKQDEFSNIEDLILRHISKRDELEQFSHIGSDWPKVQISPFRRQECHKTFLAALAYKEMDHRRTNIAEAHEATFKWVLKDRTGEHLQHPFVCWLESDNPLYWITCKAGSGKSTLMKFIGQKCGSSNETNQCRKHLLRWAGAESKLLIVSFYFWSAGAAVEASLKGLLQSLLHQLVQHHPKLISEVMPSKWEAWCLFGTAIPEFNEAELWEMLTTSIERLISQYGVKACFLIDGLDEFEGRNDDIIAICKSLLGLGHVKLCVSSRPLNRFEDAFGQQASLRLQDLTSADILEYITARFAEDEGFNRLQQREPQYALSFVQDIADKSSGVFLWVKLVVSSLLSGLRNDDRLSDLQGRLDSLPPELEDLFQAIIKSLNPFYFQHASQYFKLLQGHSGPPSAILFYFADVEDLRTILDWPTTPAAESERRNWIATIRRRLNSRCKGLLEVTRSDDVQYLHRSVKDYLLTSDLGRRVDVAAGNFDCNRQLCAAYLALLKRDEFVDDDEASTHCEYAKKCLIYAAKISGDKAFTVDVLDCLETTVQSLNDSIRGMSCFYKIQPEYTASSLIKRYGYCSLSFLAVTVRFGVVHYVDTKVSPDGLALQLEIRGKGSDFWAPGNSNRSRFKRIYWRFLGHNTIPAFQKFGLPSSHRTPAWPLLLDACCCVPPNKGMFQCLLSRGANYNMIVNKRGTTVWEVVYLAMLGRVIAQGSNLWVERGAWNDWVPILKLFHEYGAQMTEDAIRDATVRVVSAKLEAQLRSAIANSG